MTVELSFEKLKKNLDDINELLIENKDVNSAIKKVYETIAAIENIERDLLPLYEVRECEQRPEV